MIELAALSGAPNRRSHGLELIKEAAELEPETPNAAPSFATGPSSSWFSGRSKPSNAGAGHGAGAGPGLHARADIGSRCSRKRKTSSLSGTSRSGDN